jgi:ureidoacrylate peracid hydrolase
MARGAASGHCLRASLTTHPGLCYWFRYTAKGRTFQNERALFMVTEFGTPQEPTGFVRPEKIVTVIARPEPLKIDVGRTAIIVVDMQNAFVSKGGMFDVFGFDISGARSVIDNNKKLINGAREAGAKIVFLIMSYDSNYVDSGGPESPNWHKELGLVMMRKNRAAWGKYVTKGSWDEEICDELKPEARDIVIRKSRYSGFHGTNLDTILKSFNIKYCVYTGVATNVCVESTLRHGYFLDYWPILVTDAVNNAGPPATGEGTLWTVEMMFGWLATTSDLLEAFSGNTSNP